MRREIPTKRLKIVLCLVSCVLCLSFINVPILAQTSLKIAVVDTDKAFEESIWGKKAIEELEKEREEWRKKADELDAKITDLQEQLAKQRNFLDDKEVEQKLRDEIKSKQMEGELLVEQGRAYLAENEQELLKPISEEVRNLIKKLAIEESYDIILEKRFVFLYSNLHVVLYVNPELDITNRVVSLLDEVYKEKVSSRAKESEKPALERSEGKDQ